MWQLTKTRQCTRFLGALLLVLITSTMSGVARDPVPSSGKPVSTKPAQTTGEAGGASVVTHVRIGEHASRTRFVIELENPVRYQVFTLGNPYRVVIDLPEVVFALPPGTGQQGRGLIGGYRFGQFQAGTSRFVIDTQKPVLVNKVFVLEAQGGFGYRIVLDLVETTAEHFQQVRQQSARLRPAPVTSEEPSGPDIRSQRRPRPRPDNSRRVVVVDPGHGGVDPGTHGSTGLQEKTVVLAFAKEFARQLKATGRYEVKLTRTTDKFIPLRQRVALARKHRADLFISIHADAVKKKNVRGMSIYTLSEKSSDREAAALARKENLSDVIAGIDLYGESNEVTDILIDLAQRETKNFSINFARTLVVEAAKKTRMLERPHRFAGFRVLKAPDVPSVLVELGFLTNRRDEKNLSSSSWRKKISRTLVHSVDKYFRDRYAEGTYGGP